MIEYFNEMTTWEKVKILGGAVIGVFGFFAIFWGAAIGCAALGGAVEVCGL